MRINIEEALNIAWIYHSNSPRYTNSRRHMCYPYIGFKSRIDKWLRLQIGYNLSDWLFLTKITVKIDGVENNLTFNRSEVSTGVQGYGVSEWVDIADSESLIREIARGEEVWIIYWGSDGRDSYQLTTNDLKVFNEIIEFYNMLSIMQYSIKIFN